MTSSDAVQIYKGIFVGDGNVGKTSLMRRYCEDRFEELRQPTEGVEFYTRAFTVEGQLIKLFLSDIAGQERYYHFRHNFYQGSHVAALVYDVTSPASFFNLLRWRDELQSLIPLLPMVVVGNKIDLEPIVPPEEAHGWAASLNMPFFQCSAHDGASVTMLFETLAILALHEQRRREQRNINRH